MPKDRPWKKPKLSFLDQAAASRDDLLPSAEPPSVKIEGRSFYSDRFYLDHVPLAMHDGKQANNQSCHCGSANGGPPPSFDRAALLRSLDLKAAILGTFTLDIAAMQKELPTLFSSTAKVPCMVLHGKKGWTLQKQQAEEQRNQVEVTNHQSATSDGEESSVNENCSIGTQDDTTVQAMRDVNDGHRVPSDTNPSLDFFPDTVHFSEITPTWLSNLPSSFSKCVDKDTGHLLNTIIGQRQYRRGVHHPKFMILVETSGSIVVVVSTSNLTQPASTDGSWIQRFPSKSCNIVCASSAPRSPSSQVKNDFGYVLSNFLQCQVLATAKAQVTTHWFVRKYLRWKSVHDLVQKYNFDDAQVDLVATIPGIYEGRFSSEMKQRREKMPESCFLYGQQRISHLVQGSPLTSEKDRLIVQPTSFGGDWNQGNMINLIRSYLGHHDRTASDAQDSELLDQLDIVWPTEDFVRESSMDNTFTGNERNHTTSKSTAEVRIVDNNPELEGKTNTTGGYLFFSSLTFNRIGLGCLSRMAMYEPSSPMQQPCTLVPHIKTAARLCFGIPYSTRKHFAIGKSEEYFSWFLLTSACLSRGAQGVETDAIAPGGTHASVAYSNFELGVLFASRLERKRKDRIYCWKPAECNCSGNVQGAQLIHLPSPYSFRPSHYVESDDEVIFVETPYFHEVPSGTESIGNMQLTPLGSSTARI